MTNESDGAPWPRIYSTTMAERMNMPQAELEALWHEYSQFWGGAQTNLNNETRLRQLQKEYSADWLEDKDGTYR